MYSQNASPVQYERRGHVKRELIRSRFVNFLILLRQHIYDILICKLSAKAVHSYLRLANDLADRKVDPYLSVEEKAKEY